MVVYEEPEVYQADIDEISRLRSLTERETVIRLLNEQITKLNAIVPKAIQQREERLKREEEERRLEEERKQRAENLKAMGVRMPKPIETTQVKKRCRGVLAAFRVRREYVPPLSIKYCIG